MCGIFGILNYNNENLRHNKIKHRGPDNSISLLIYDKYFFCFHRLSINDLSEKGNQPFETNDYIIMCNGEIYNYKKLIQQFDLKCEGNSDCEVISKLYEKFKDTSFINLLDGVFAISIYNKNNNKLYLIRDYIGIRPLYYNFNNINNILEFASEGKALNGKNITQLKPGSILEYSNNKISITSFYSLPSSINNKNKDFIKFNLKQLFIESIKKRLISDRPIGCLLSGGLDSSLVASILSNIYDKPIKTFSVGFKDSEDLKYAKQVSNYLGTDHYELIIDYESSIKRIPEVIKCLETYDITTIRASIGMYLLSEYISKNHSERVIFSGEGSDELFAGYLYFHKSNNNKDIENETKRLVSDLYKYDVLRADRCTSAFGLELRVPFLDRDFVNFVLNLDGSLRKPFEGIEKHLLRISFENNYLPKDILYRKKEAFSDGVGGIKKPFYKHIQEYIKKSNIQIAHYFSDDDIEKIYYKNIYNKFYSYKPIDYYWMPKWVSVNNPSARIL